jgi:polysaccharide deacetylase family protein (PEP-CTERM system associated)
MAHSRPNAMTVDVEDWFQVGAFEGVIDRASWPHLPARVEQNVDRILHLFADAGMQATFFALAWIAERYPQMMRRIAQAGHEIASHGCLHERVHHLQPSEFALDCARSRAILEDVTGQAVTGYRAPSFSIDHRTPWAHAILAENGYLYSSSVAPIRHDHYGWPGSPRFLWHPLAGQDFVEIPVSTARLMGRVVPAGGGGFFRLYPYALSRQLIRRIHDEGRSAIFYFHPWEMDPDQPFERKARLRSRVRHYTNLRTMRAKIRRLTDDFCWGRLDAMVFRERQAMQ